MKKIISSLIVLSILNISCSNKTEEKTQNIIPKEDIPIVVGIGKILPKDGITLLSVKESNKVIKILKKVGDTVSSGDVLFEMEITSQGLQFEAAKAALNSTKESNQTTKFDLNIAENKLKELEQIFKTSKKLKLQKAETQQQVFLDSIAFIQQKEIVKQLAQKIKAENAIMNEKNIKIKESEWNIKNQKYQVLQDGVLIRFDLNLGEIINANENFGELANTENLVIKAEVDELYASKIKVGQTVEIVAVGQTNTIAHGEISFVGSSLQNKSILYETNGEGSDRRVRHFTVTISKKESELLINQKVECKIKI